MDRLDAVVQELRNAAVEPAATPARNRRRPRRPSWRWLALLLIPVLGFVGFMFMHRATTTRSVPAPIATIVTPNDPWTDTLADIDAARMQAFIDDDPAALLIAEVNGSPAHTADLAIMTDLRMRDVTLDRNPLHVLSIREEYVTLTGEVKRARLRVTDAMDAYSLIDESGTVVTSRPARATRTWYLDLQRTKTTRWKLVRVTAAATSQSSAPAIRRGT